MQSQNVNLIKPNKSSIPPQINIYQLPQLHPITPPLFNKQFTQPLSLTYDQVKSLHKKPSTNQSFFLPSNKPVIPPRMSISSPKNELQNLKSQLALTKQNLQQMTRLYEQQKLKYNELKNLYKEGQAMFQILQDKKITLQKENKELKQMLENFYQQLHLENSHFQKDSGKKQTKINLNEPNLNQNITNTNMANPNKIQKIKIGNKKIPVIKVNVPPQTFIKKQHSSSVFSQNSEVNTLQTNTYKQEISILKQQIEQLKKFNKQLQNQVSDLKQKLSKSQKPQQLGFKQIKLQNYTFSESFNHGRASQYHENQQNVSFYKSKYNILETQVKKKDEALKNLYNQCYSLQEQINKLKAQSSSFQTTMPNSNQATRQAWTQQKHLSQFNVPKENRQTVEQKLNQSFQSKGQWFYQSKISQLEKRVNELNQLCISNVSQTFRINQLNDHISKLIRENNQNQQKIINQETQLARLYKILQNKNNQLSEIYTTITESKRNYNLDESKKKSFNNIFINTPQKNHEFSSQNLFYSKGFSKDQSFQ